MVSRDNKMDDDYFGTLLNSSMNMPFNLEVGDIVSGRVSQIDDEFVYVSTGFKSEGRIPREEFLTHKDQELTLKVDDEVEVMVDRMTSEEIFLSYKKVVEQRRWNELVKSQEDEEPVDARVIKMVKGGFRLDVGVGRHAFLPSSHWGGPVPTASEEIEGMDVRVLIIEIDIDSGNIIVSRRDLVRKELADKQVEVFDSVKPGEIIEGKVTRLTNFGAFVDVGGVEGLAHVSELAWARVGHPSQVLSCGDTVNVKVLEVDTESKKISLSIKQAGTDPWQNITEQYKPDSIVEGTVTRVVKYGMFVKLDEVFEGLLHNSEFPQEEGKRPGAGDKIKVKIIDIDTAGRRIKLGLAEAGPAAVSEEMERYIDKGGAGITLGDVIDGALDNSGNDKPES